MRLGDVDISTATRMVVIGAGESGIGVALLAVKLGIDVYVSDSNKIKPSYKEELIKNNIRFEEGGHKVEWLFNVHVAIKSPGVPDHAPPVRSLTEYGIPFFSEIEFGYHYYTGSLLAVTGSNGKTTTSGLLSHVLQTASFDVALGGNVGISMCRILAERQPDYMVLEVSSFQLDNVRDFRPDISILLNITEDHLDRYDYNFDLYADAKIKIASRQRRGDTFIYNADDSATVQRLDQIDRDVQLVAISEVDYATQVSRDDGRPYGLALQGRHNRFNAAAVVAAARSLGIAEDDIDRGLSTYSNYPHRLEHVADIADVAYINDSKATNVDAVYYALESMERPVVWIAGGTDKGNDYRQIAALVSSKVKALISLGVDNQALDTWFTQHFGDKPIFHTQDMKEAIELSQVTAVAGDAVLLSPACASFDLFRNYEDRGDQYRAAVLASAPLSVLPSTSSAD